MRNHILHKNPGLPERDIMLKCQHCRFMQCITAGMKEEYVQGKLRSSSVRELNLVIRF